MVMGGRSWRSWVVTLGLLLECLWHCIARCFRFEYVGHIDGKRASMLNYPSTVSTLTKDYRIATIDSPVL
jgi:hypothetical protein